MCCAWESSGSALCSRAQLQTLAVEISFGCGMQVPVCVATSSHKRHFDLKTQKHGPFFQRFDHIITGDNVENGKPAPDIFLKACGSWNTPPSASCCLVFEDAPSGVAAAKAAGMHCVMVPDPNLDRASTKEADVVINSLLEVPLEQFGLPPLPT